MDEHNFEYLTNIIKGTIAEKTFEAMMTNSGFNVFRFGYEHRTPNLAHSIRSNQSNEQIYRPKETIESITSTPDFILTSEQRKTKENIFMVEVKFRQALKYENDEYSLFQTAGSIYHHYKDAYLFILCLNPLGIFFDSVRDITETNSNEIKPIHQNKIMSLHGITEEITNKYMKTAEIFLLNETNK